jgi:hypothetical protein
MSRNRTLALVVAGAFGLPFLTSSTPAGADAKKGAEIGAKVDKAWAGYKSEENEIDLELISGDGSKVVRKLKGKAREVGSDEQSLMLFIWPADLKGTKLLTYNHRNQADDQWLYLPSVQRVKRISGSRSRSGSFMGSEMAFEDLTNVWWIQKYTYDYLKDQKVGSRDTWVVDRVPKDKDSGYSKQTLWIDKEYLTALRIQYYDRKGKLLKTADFKSWKKYGNKWRADRVEMVNRQTGKKTNVVWKSRKMGVSLAEDEFSSDSLPR